MATAFLNTPVPSITGGAVTITASNSVVYDPPLRALNVAVAGAVALVFGDGTTATLNLIAGVIHPVGGISKVMLTGTTATGIVGFAA